jgi:hypothetical protein
MPDADLSRLGLRVGGADELDLFLVKFTGEVMSRFKTQTKFLGKNTVRTITEGKAARFDAMGGAVGRYRNIGEDLMESAQQIDADEFTIALDKPFIAHVAVDEYDELLNHYEVRGKYATELALALALNYDRNIAACGIKAARAAARMPGGHGGSVLTITDGDIDVKALVEGIYAAAQTLDEKNVPDVGRNLFIRPSTYYRLAQNYDLINTLYGGTGSVREGDVIKIAGITLVKTNTLPVTNITTDIAKYNVDASKTLGLVMTNEAVGTVQRQNVTTSADWIPNHRSILLTAQYLMGHDYLRPECAVELVWERSPEPEPEE